MVSKASDDLPEPLTPVKTVSLSRRISTVRFRRLCVLAPMTSSVVLNCARFHCLDRDSSDYLITMIRSRSRNPGNPSIRRIPVQTTSVQHPLELQAPRAEVDQQPHLQTVCLQVVERLREVYVLQLNDRLELHHYD